MKLILVTKAVVLTVTASLLALAAPRAAAQNVLDEIEVARSTLKADRKIIIAEGLQLTEAESAAFWPLYRQYRAEMDKCADGIVELVLEYADLYPNVPEDRAKKLLKDYTALEQKYASQRAWYLKKFTKVLPAVKAMRFAQLENRLDLAVRLRLASVIPLVPADAKVK